MRIKVIIGLQILIVLFSSNTFSCTIFYLSGDSIILAGATALKKNLMRVFQKLSHIIVNTQKVTQKRYIFLRDY